MTLGKLSFFRKGITNKKKSEAITLTEALNKIKNTENKDDILNIRKTTDKNLRSSLKKGLDYFTFSGTFKERTEQGLITHSGIICIDFDLNGWKKIKGEDNIVTEFFETSYNIAEIKEQISKDKYTLCVFISPSGDGLKVLVKIDSTQHLASFKWLEKYYKENYKLDVDPSGKDVCRACFTSLDPEPFLNLEAERASFDPAEAAAPAKIVFNHEELNVDKETGEVIEKEDIKTWPRKKAEELERVIEVANRIFVAKTDVTSSYDDWQMMAFSLACFGEHGRSIFHKISQFNSEYKFEEADKKFTNAINTGRFENAAKFFTIAKSYGITTNKVKTLGVAVAEGAEESANMEAYTILLPDGMQIDDKLRKHIFYYSFLEHNNQYWYGKFDNVKRQVDFYPISNFVIIPLFLIQSKSEPKRIVEIVNMYGQSKVLDVPAEAFVAPQQLYAFLESNGNFLFEGDRKQLQKVKSKLYNLTSNALPMNVLGWHKDGFYAFSNGIYTAEKKFQATDDYGIVEHNNVKYFIPALSSIYRDEEEEFESHKKFIFIKSKTTFKEWSELMIKAHGENGLIAICFFFATTFRDFIFERTRFFPMLFGFGPPGTGKSTLGNSLIAMYGIPSVPFTLKSGTKVAFHKSWAQFTNAIVWFDEYSNSIDPERIAAIKSAYDGAGHNKSEMTTANRTKNTPVKSGAYVSGQELPVHDYAAFTRFLLLQFYETLRNEEATKNLDALKAIEKAGLSHITAAISALRPLMEQNYTGIHSEVLKDLKEILGDKYSNIDNRIVVNFAVILATYRTLAISMEHVLPASYEDLLKIVADKIVDQNRLIGNSKDTSVFWEMVQFLFERSFIHDKEDFKIEYHSSIKLIALDGQEINRVFIDNETNTSISKRVLFLRLSTVHPLYLKHHREQHSKNGMDKGSLVNYLQHTPSFLGKIGSTRFRLANTFAFCFDYDALEKDGFILEKVEMPEEVIPPSPQSTVKWESKPEITFTPNPNINDNSDDLF